MSASTATSDVVWVDGRPTVPELQCPHGVDHPRWCPTCRDRWEARMRHPAWPRRYADDGTPVRA